jgi:hypothetical protein
MAVGNVERLLQQERAKAAMYRESGITSQLELAQFIEGLVQRVETALKGDGYMTCLPEDKAIEHSGRTQRWLRARYSVWAEAGHAYKQSGIRYYRRLVLPWRSAKDQTAYQAGLNPRKRS